MMTATMVIFTIKVEIMEKEVLTWKGIRERELDIILAQDVGLKINKSLPGR